MPTPLAETLRPQTLDNYIGQQHLVGKNAILRRSIESGNIPSMILWGPPGVGKTTLANVISNTLNKEFYTLSAVSSGVKDVRNVIRQAAMFNGNAILFIDEIHRFSKSQQDSLLSAVEKGTITLIGATTENPSFEVISPLLSRCQVYILSNLEADDLRTLIKNGIQSLSEKFDLKITVDEDEALLRLSGGDARKLYNALELVVYQEKTNKKKIKITNNLVKKIIQENLAIYDKQGEMHYDVISAFIKSIRGSDPNAAVYWLARMVEAGEDPKFIARRMLILASEDIGNANPNALLLANTCMDAINKIGWPEGRIILSQTAVFLANSEKSNSSYLAIKDAQSIVQKTGNLAVPLHLRNAPTKLMKDIGYGKDYKYAHQHEDNFVDLEFLPDKISGTKFYEPGNNIRENEDRKKLLKRWKSKYGY
ncbi:MAG: AAA family ATPase [Bacteroidetes bacterium]|jgi:putative ATPase|nr:AAA family ATPase [Bacteroidota bacterium]|tara:strand:+ start:1082 stop:2350 length:1269 start_codon:yes stop_codon:yes gene_type:complete